MDDQPELGPTPAEQPVGASPSRRAVRAAKLALVPAGSEQRPTAQDIFPTAKPAYSLTVGEAMREGLIDLNYISAELETATGSARLALLGHEINMRMDIADRADAISDDQRVQSAILLADAKATCIEKKQSFHKWCEITLPHRYENIRKLASAGSEPDVRAAVRKIREDTAARMRKHREQQKLAKDFVEGVVVPSEETTANVRAVQDASGKPRAIRGLDIVNADRAVIALSKNINAVEDLNNLKILVQEAAVRLNPDQQREVVLTLRKETGLTVGKERGFKVTLASVRSDFLELADDDRATFLAYARQIMGTEAPETHDAN